MTLFLILIPVLTIISALFMYRFTGRKDIMKFDLVQFAYAFIVSPVMLLWLKFFFFFLLSKELNLKLTVNQLFLFDTILTMICLYVFAFVVIHTLTKTIDLYRNKNPLYDVFEHIEYFHLNISHLVIYLGIMCVLSFVSSVNLFIPTTIEASQQLLYIVVAFGTLTGVIGMVCIWLYESPDLYFHKLIKLALGFFFLYHAVLYFLLDPNFSLQYVGYWYMFTIFFTCSLLSLFAEKNEKRKRFKFIPFNLNWRKPSYYARRARKVITSRMLEFLE